ncbi:MAG TPA: ABC transporter substrate binding protein [Dissulfurispiraceae bacterium]|nr:ABC transporter substrate binding protein [Dissulfurispiraceae bacterium]
MQVVNIHYIRNSAQGIIRLILITFFLLSISVSHSGAGNDAGAKRRILVLNSYHKGLSWTDNIVKGVESVFLAEAKQLEISYEYMDTKRNSSERYFAKLYEIYKIKYEKERFDVIIACDNDALNFISKYRKTLFSNTPIVFCGINDFQDSMVWDPSTVTGVVEETDMKSTLDIALKLFPSASQVVVIDDKTTTGVAMKNELLKVMPNFRDKVHFVFFEDFDIAELKQKVRNISSDCIILLLLVNRDRTGNFFSYEESLSFIYNEARVPIFSVWDFYLGGGMAGGMLTSGYSQGKTAAEMALHIMNGVKVSEIPVVRKSPNRFMFDYVQLKRFGVSTYKLPKESVIINLPDSFYSKHKTFIFATGATIFSLSLIIFVLLVNISQRRKVEKALRVSEEKYRDLYDNAPDMYHSINGDGIIIDCNETEARMLGYMKEEIIGRPVTDFWTEESKKRHEQAFPIIKMEKQNIEIEREFVRKGGDTFIASLHVFSETDSNNRFVRTKTIARDITASKLLENELKNSREELRNLSAHLQSVREEERRCVAGEIHDELGQVLTTLKLDLSWLKTRLAKENNRLSENVQPMSDLVDKTIGSVQRISSELRPGVLDHLGLPDAIEWLASEVCGRKGLQYDILIEPEDMELDQNRSIAVFRIFQEAITNIVRHAHATMVEVRLKKGKSSLTMEVRDNGIGIPVEKLSDHNSYGLIGIRERARYLGGDAKIERREPGTSVVVNIPLGGEDEVAE